MVEQINNFSITDPLEPHNFTTSASVLSQIKWTAVVLGLLFSTVYIIETCYLLSPALLEILVRLTHL